MESSISKASPTPKLEYRHISYDLTLCYQFLNGYCDTTLTDCFTNCPINFTRDNIHKLYKSCCTVDATIISPIESPVCGTVSQIVLLLLLLCQFFAVR